MTNLKLELLSPESWLDASAGMLISGIEYVLPKVGIPEGASIFQVELHCGQMGFQK